MMVFSLTASHSYVGVLPQLDVNSPSPPVHKSQEKPELSSGSPHSMGPILNTGVISVQPWASDINPSVHDPKGCRHDVLYLHLRVALSLTFGLIGNIMNINELVNGFIK